MLYSYVPVVSNAENARHRRAQARVSTGGPTAEIKICTRTMYTWSGTVYQNTCMYRYVFTRVYPILILSTAAAVGQYPRIQRPKYYTVSGSVSRASISISSMPRFTRETCVAKCPIVSARLEKCHITIYRRTCCMYMGNSTPSHIVGAAFQWMSCVKKTMNSCSYSCIILVSVLFSCVCCKYQMMKYWAASRCRAVHLLQVVVPPASSTKIRSDAGSSILLLWAYVWHVACYSMYLWYLLPLVFTSMITIYWKY